MMDVWKEEVTLRFGNIDKSDRLTLNAVFGFFQEAAISHATVLGVGKDALEDNGQAWILSRISVFIKKRPKYREIVTVRSWPRGSEKLFALRNYDITGSSGDVLAIGKSGWLIIDIEKRKPLRTSIILEKLPVNEGLDVMLTGPSGLAARDNLAIAGERQAAYSDIDNFGHVNNVRYVQWIQDITSRDLLENAGQMRMDINYLSEVMPDEKVDLYSGTVAAETAGNGYPSPLTSVIAYEGRKPVSGQSVFRAELWLGN